MKKYDAYKDSGIDWIGEIPLKYIAKIQKGKLPKNLVDKNEGDIPMYLSMDVMRGNEKDAKYVEDYASCILAKEGDVLVLWDGSNAGEVMLSKQGVISSTIALLKVNNNIDARFFFYQLKSKEQLIKDSSVGMGIPHVNPQELNQLSFYIPSFSVQKEIAEYLDKKTAKIDDLIADKEELLKLYEEEKTAVINDLVAGKRTWDGNAWTEPAEVKDSGIEWLGEIPEHWRTTRLKYVAFFKRGHDLSSNNFIEGDIPVYGSNGIIGYHNEYTTLGPSITVGRSGSVGEVNYVKEARYWAHNTSLFLLKKHENNIDYLYYLLKVLDLKSYAAGTAVGTLNRNNIHEIEIAIPGNKEQKSIVDFIKSEVTRISTKIEDTRKLIDLFKEYREALISEVVTGKVKVV